MCLAQNLPQAASVHDESIEWNLLYCISILLGRVSRNAAKIRFV